MQQEKKIYRKANLVYEDCDIKPGHTIKLYGEETIVKGFHVSYNDALGRWETIILTEGRGDPFERTLADIEVLEDQPDESPSKEGNKEAVEFAEWVLNSGYYPIEHHKRMWSGASIGSELFTTEQLYEQFKNGNNA